MGMFMTRAIATVTDISDTSDSMAINKCKPLS